LREDGYDRDRNWEPRGASLWDHVDAAARTKEKKKKGAVSLESDDEGWIEARRPSTSRASFDASQRWAPQTPSFGPGVSIGPNAPPPSASMAAFPSLGGGDVGSPAGSSPIVSGHGSPSGPGFAFGTGPPSAVAAAAAAAAPADNPALALQVWMQRCRSGCPPGHEARPLLDDLIKKRVKSLIDSVGGVASRVDWASQDTSFAEQCVRRAEQERETLRALERARGGDSAAGDATASRPFILFGVDPSTIGADTGVAELVARHIRHLIQLCIERKEQNVERFLAGTAFREDDDDTAASRLCAASVLRRAPEAAVNVLRSNGFEVFGIRRDAGRF
jgi:hypothetical protein